MRLEIARVHLFKKRGEIYVAKQTDNNKENQDKKVLVGFNGIDGKEVTLSKLKDDINEIRDSKSTFLNN